MTVRYRRGLVDEHGRQVHRPSDLRAALSDLPGMDSGIAVLKSTTTLCYTYSLLDCCTRVYDLVLVVRYLLRIWPAGPGNIGRVRRLYELTVGLSYLYGR